MRSNKDKIMKFLRINCMQFFPFKFKPPICMESINYIIAIKLPTTHNARREWKKNSIDCRIAWCHCHNDTLTFNCALKLSLREMRVYAVISFVHWISLSFVLFCFILFRYRCCLLITAFKIAIPNCLHLNKSVCVCN